MGDYDIISDKFYVTHIQGIFENNNPLDYEILAGGKINV